MTQKVLKVGTSAAVTIPKGSLKDLGLKIGDLVTVEVNKERATVTLKPLKQLSATDERVAHLTKAFVERYRSDLKELAKE